jgi:hypothetical protein
MAIRNTTINRGLNGLNPLSYMGDNPTTPPDFYSISRDPGPNDWQDFMLCDLWLNTTNQNVWVLVSLNNNQATWVMFAGGGFGPIIGILADNGVIAHAIAGVINLFAQPQAGSSVTFSAATNVIKLNVTNGLNVTAIGLGAGAAGPGANTTALGFQAAQSLTAGASTLIGTQAGRLITTGAQNTGVGYGVFTSGVGAGVTTGGFNIGLGYFAGSTYTGAESSNILIGSPGINAESHTIHIGTNGVGNSQQSNTYLDGGNVLIPTGNLTVINGFVSANNTMGGGAGTAFFSNSNAAADLSGAPVSMYQNSSNIYGSTLALAKTRAGGVITSGDILGSIDFDGFDANTVIASAGFTVGAAIQSVSSGTIGGGGASRVPANLQFLTFPNVASGPLTLRMTISSAGNVIISAPDSGVAFNSIATFGQAVGGSGTAVFVDNAGNFGTSVSSRRFKENILDMNSDSSDIFRLRPVTFDYIDDTRLHRQYGLIAEEVNEVMPELVSFDKDGLVQTVKYHDLVPMLLNEIQKLNKRVELLEQK